MYILDGLERRMIGPPLLHTFFIWVTMWAFSALPIRLNTEALKQVRAGCQSTRTLLYLRELYFHLVHRPEIGLLNKWTSTEQIEKESALSMLRLHCCRDLKPPYGIFPLNMEFPCRPRPHQKWSNDFISFSRWVLIDTKDGDWQATQQANSEPCSLFLGFFLIAIRDNHQQWG